MSLNWDATKVENFEEKFYEKCGDEQRVKGSAEAMIFSTMFLGINTITEKNVEDFFVRMNMWERTFGNLRTHSEKFSLEEIREYIGLHTNASPMTKTQFRKRLFDSLQAEATRALRLQKAEKKTA